MFEAYLDLLDGESGLVSREILFRNLSTVRGLYELDQLGFRQPIVYVLRYVSIPSV